MKLGLIGEVLGHSLSPAIHEALFQEMKLDSSYDLVEIPKADFATRLPQVLAAYDGLNVTIPYKVDVISYLDEISKEAETIGAVNTIAKRDGKLVGFNTDYFGFQRTLRKIHVDVKGKQVVVLGHGGASRAIIQCLYDEGASDIHIASRHPQTVDAAFRDFAEKRNGTILSYEEIEAHPTGALLVNTTPCGMFPKIGVSPVTAQTAAAFPKVIDIIYNPAETQLLHDAVNAEKSNGLYMLVMQAMAAEEIWMAREISPSTVEKVIEAVAGKLGMRK